MEFAKLNDDNVVTEIQECDSVETLISITGHKNWKAILAPTKNKARIGDSYIEQYDAFISPKPYPSWILDDIICRYVAPKPRPVSNDIYKWNESILDWEKI
jgi:hypothetical protein